MKIAHSTLAALIVFTCAAPSQQAGSAQGTNPTFSLSISAAQEVVKSGSAVTVQVVLTNISDHKIGFPWLLGHPAWNYELNVRDSQGNAVQPAPRNWVDKDGRHHARIRAGSVTALSLEPGEAMKHEFDVRDFKTLAQPGKYTIQVQRTDDESKSEVKSNTLTVTVTP